MAESTQMATSASAASSTRSETRRLVPHVVHQLPGPLPGPAPIPADEDEVDRVGDQLGVAVAGVGEEQCRMSASTSRATQLTSDGARVSRSGIGAVWPT